jgi:hypothetical protein
MKRIYISTLVSAAAGIAAVGLVAGCSSNSGSGSPAAAASASSTGNAAYSAYTQCLSQHGVTLPSGGAFGGGRRSHSPGAGFTPRARPSGGFGGGFGGGFASADPSFAAAAQACSSLRPTGAAGFGGGGGGFGGGSSRLTAFRNCMTQQGEAVPTTRPTAVSTATGDARYLDGLDSTDPKVAAALKVCEPLIPTPTVSPTA